MNKKKMLMIITAITGFAFLLLLSLLLKDNNLQKTITMDKYPQMFKTIKRGNTNSSQAISPTPNTHGFNIGSTNFKVFCEQTNHMYVLKCSYNNNVKYLMNFYDQPLFNYGVFNDKNSFWVIISNEANNSKYKLYAFYNINNPKAVKLYENDIEEAFKSLRIDYKNDIISISSPSEKVHISKYGQSNKD